MTHEIPDSEPKLLSEAQQDIMDIFLHDFYFNLEPTELNEIHAHDQTAADLRDDLGSLAVYEIKTREDYFKYMAGFILGVSKLSALREYAGPDINTEDIVGALMIAFAELAPDELKNRT